MEPTEVLREAAQLLLSGKDHLARSAIRSGYGFASQPAVRRKASAQKMLQFWKDGFIDRYSGERLVNPGLLKILSATMPEDFPYHPHWRMDSCHQAYWQLAPTLDHIEPVALGGADDESNWATTSMLHNAVKANWTLGQLGWKLHSPGSSADWDGLCGLFLQIVDARPKLLMDPYIRKWHRLTVQARQNPNLYPAA